MNTYVFEYDTVIHKNKTISYNANALVDAIRKFKKNCKTAWQVLDILENGHSLRNALYGIEFHI